MSFMPRKLLIRSEVFPYHITNRSNNRELFHLELSELWPIFLEALREIEFQFGCETLAFVLMSNHYHLIVKTPNANIGEAMKYFHREVARKSNRAANRINHFFGGRYQWSLIANENYYWNALKYVFRNPVKAKICSNVMEYRYSSLNSMPPDFKWKLVDPFSDEKLAIEFDIAWLNEAFGTEKERGIQLALRRREFSPPRGFGGKPIQLDASPCKKGTVT